MVTPANNYTNGPSWPVYWRVKSRHLVARSRIVYNTALTVNDSYGQIVLYMIHGPPTSWCTCIKYTTSALTIADELPSPSGGSRDAAPQPGVHQGFLWARADHHLITFIGQLNVNRPILAIETTSLTLHFVNFSCKSWVYKTKSIN